MTVKSKMGRPTVFGPKDRSYRFQGWTTTAGGKAFERQRKHLSKLAGLPVDKVSDGDVFEFLARGEAATVEYLAART